MIVDVFGDIREQFTADLIGFPVKNDDIYRHIVLQQKFPDGVHRHAKRLIFWITVNAGGEQRERRRLAMVFLCQRKACPVAGNELFPFSIAAAAPHRTDGMNHILAGQAVRLCNLCFACHAAAQSPALCQQLRSCRPMDTAVHTSTAQKRFICRIDDSANLHFRNVVANNDKGHRFTTNLIIENQLNAPLSSTFSSSDSSSQSSRFPHLRR